MANKTAVASKDAHEIRRKEPIRHNFGFNSSNKRRKPVPVAAGGKSVEEMVADFLKTNSITVVSEPVRYAEGAVKTSGYYDFGKF